MGVEQSTGILEAMATAADPLAHGAFPDLTANTVVEESSSLGQATVTVEVLGWDLFVELAPPEPRELCSHFVVVSARGQEDPALVTRDAAATYDPDHRDALS
jgi:hypothetical protein